MARWPRTSSSSSSSGLAASTSTSTSASAARSSSWWWWWLLPLPVASAFKRLLLRLMALWLNSPLRRLRISSRPAFLRLGGREDDDRDREMRSFGDNEHEGDGYCRLPESESLLALKNSHGAQAIDAVGLVNVGNTCFVNAVLQCLAVLPAFHASVEQEIEALQVLQSERGDGGGDDSRHREKQLLRLQTAKTLLELLKSLTPVPFALRPERSARDEDDDNSDEEESAYDNKGAAVKRRRRNEHARSNGSARKPVRRVDRETVTAQVRAFLDATRKCTNLISGKHEQQEQQDAEEFLSFLLELLHELLLPVRCGNSSPSVSSLPPLNPQEQEYFRQGEEFFAQELKKCKPLDPRSYTDVVSGLGDLRWQRFLKQNNSVVTDLFVGQIVRGSQCCSCANLTCLHQELRVLSLSVNASASSQSLVNCLEAHRHAEHLVDENRVFCEGYCHMKTSRITQVLFQRAPPVLVVQLQRFKQSSGWGLQLEKIGTPVSFPSDDLLDITENMFVRNEAQHVRYKLVAVCAHVGNSIDSGHYVAYVNRQHDRESTAQWLRMDDDVGTALDGDTFREETLSSAYILFYTRVTG